MIKSHYIARSDFADEIEVTIQLTFELIKREVILGGPDLIRGALLTGSDRLLPAGLEKANCRKFYSCKEDQFCQQAQELKGEPKALDDTPALTDGCPEQRMQRFSLDTHTHFAQ